MGKTTVFGERWNVIRSLNEGGQGWVYVVRDLREEIKEDAVLKRLKNLGRIARFEREIEAYMRLEHPGIPPIVDYSVEGKPFIVMPYYTGQALAEMEPCESLKALDIFIELCQIVAYGHETGVVHRDLKPENVLLTDDGQVIVLDFGLCHFLDEDKRLTAKTEPIGSRYYMAPELEQGRADEVTSKSDSYSLGKILFFLMAGKPPYRENITGENELGTITRNSQLHYVTDRILKKCITTAPEERLQATELADVAMRVRNLIFEHFYPGKQGTKCRFCGEGTYQNLQLRDCQLAIISNVHSADRRTGAEAFVCDSCGNVQWFVPDWESVFQGSETATISESRWKILL